MNSILEWIRCARHNLLHLRHFRLTYARNTWFVRYGGTSMRFPYYPYLAFQDIEGYFPSEAFVPRPGATVVDVGGCYGEYSLLASFLVGEAGRVIMVEPDPANIDRARTLFELNGAPKNIECFQGALGDRDGRATFLAGLGPESALASANDDAETWAKRGITPREVDVEVLTLGSLSKRFGLDRIDIVKMDVEGGELAVMEGAKTLPETIRPCYAIASYHVVDGRKTADSLPLIFSAMGYEAQTGNPSHLTTWARPVEK